MRLAIWKQLRGLEINPKYWQELKYLNFILINEISNNDFFSPLRLNSTFYPGDQDIGQFPLLIPVLIIAPMLIINYIVVKSLYFLTVLLLVDHRIGHQNFRSIGMYPISNHLFRFQLLLHRPLCRINPIILLISVKRENQFSIFNFLKYFDLFIHGIFLGEILSILGLF